jgi:hypothetical protein
LVKPLSDNHNDILQALISREKSGGLDKAMFEDIPIEVYHHPECPGISSTRLKAIIERNWNYAGRSTFTATPAMEFGTAFHAFIQGDMEAFVKEYAIGKFDSARKYLSYDDYAKLQTMRDRVEAHPEAGKLLVGAHQEWTFFSRDPATGVLRKVRPDLFQESVLGDWKTTVNASQSEFIRSCKKYLYRISARYYMDVFTAATDRPAHEFKLIAVESEGLHDVAVYPISENSLMTARGEIDQALSAIARARDGGWTGYALNQAPIFI